VILRASHVDNSVLNATALVGAAARRKAQDNDRIDLATVRLRTKVTKGAGSRSAGLAMAYKLIATAESRWRAVNAPHLVALVRAGALFHNGVLVERSEEVAA